LKNVIAVALKPSSLAETPGYKTPEALAALTFTGAGIDLAGWNFFKPVQLASAGVQQLELDMDVLAHATADFRDLRLVRDGKQLPFLVERPSILRVLALNGTAAVDPKRPDLSRWQIKLPQAGIPVARLVCVSPSPLFRRDMRLWEEITDERGGKYSSELGRAAWQQTPERANREFAIQFDRTPATDTLFLETENGDNPPIELREFRSYYPVTRLVFKAAPDAQQPLRLYYGNRDASAPQYDLSLVAGQILRAEKTSASLGGEERADGKSGKSAVAEPTERGGLIFWGVLAVVVVALLALIARLLPKPV
jgi:hypothetical protein